VPKIGLNKKKNTNMSRTLNTAPADTILGHPKGLFVLFFTEMWERFSYYGMRALLILYLTKHFLFGDEDASLIYGSYASLVYAMPVLGGLIADRYLGFRKAIVFGAILLVCGHFGMAFEGPQLESKADINRSDMYTQIFYLSLAFIVVGVGFLKANISTIVGQLYPEGDPRRDAGFTIFYMGINVGSFVATLLCAYLGETYGWRYGFGMAGIGMLLGLVTFLRGKKHLLGEGEPPVPAILKEKVLPGINKEQLIYLVGLLAVVGVWQVIQRTSELGVVLIAFGVIVVGWVIWFSVAKLDPRERDRMLVMLFLIIVSVLFWALFEQAGSSLTLFTDRNVDMGETFTAGMFQSMNPLFIILLAPLFAVMWIFLARKGYEPSTPAKFGLGILQVGLGFAVLIYGASQAGPDGKVSVIWLALMYLLHTTGELCLSPVGLSMVTKLSVQRVAAMMMGVWFLSSAFAAYAGGMIAALTSINDEGEATKSGIESLAVYTGVFENLAMVAVCFGLAILIISPFLHRKMR